MIDVFCNSHIGIQKYSSATEVRENEAVSTLSKDVYGCRDDATNGKYVLCLWNDQKHSFTDALNVILGATQKKIDFGKMVTKRIDSVGRATVIVSNDLSKLMDKKKKMEMTGLVNTVRSAKDHFREEMCGTICYWLDDLSKSSLKSNYFVLRLIMSEVLCGTWNYGTEMLKGLGGDGVDVGGASASSSAGGSGSGEELIRLHSFLEGARIPDISKRAKRTKHVPINNPDEDEDDEDEEIYDEDEIEGRIDEGRGGEEEETVEEIDRGAAAAREFFNAQTPGRGPIITIAGERIEIGRRPEPEPEEILSGPSGTGGKFSISTNNQKIWRNTGPSPPPPFGTDLSTNIASRVQYLIFFDIRLWKDLRLTLRDLYISVLVSNPTCKTLLGHYYGQLYPQIAELYMLADREPECSIISSLSTQLYTTPTIATDLLKYDYFTKLVAALYTFFTTGEVGPPSAVDADGFINLESRVLKNRRFGQLFHDIEYLLNRNTEKDLVSANVDRIGQIAELMLLFQGMSPIRRQRDKHVEYESETWIYFFNAVPYVVQLAMVVASGISYCKDKEKCYNSIGKVVGVLCTWAFGGYLNRFKTSSEITSICPVFKANTVSFGGKVATIENIDFKVEHHWVSLHHPLNSYLSWLIEYTRFDDAKTLRRVLINGARSSDSMNGSKQLFSSMDDEHLLQLIFEHPIRVLSLLSQIHIGLWVRNGYSVRSQLHHYREFTLRDSAFVRDVFMAQTALVVLKPNTVMMQLLTRFSLIEWESNPLFDISQRLYMVEEFLHHLIFLLMERTQLIGLPEKEVKKKYIRKEIIQCLSFRDMAFSDICKIVPDYLSSDEMFESILREIAVFKPPSGVRDYGLYQLKSECYKEFDTHYIHFSSAKIEEAEGTIKNKIHKSTGEPLQSIVHEPPLEPIKGPYSGLAAFSRTVPFGKFVYDVLKFIIRDRSASINEGVLGQLLQLFHVIALDDLSEDDDYPVLFKTTFFSLGELICVPIRPNSDETIVSLLCQMLELSEFSEFGAKIRRIFNLIMQKDPHLVGVFHSYIANDSIVTRDSTPNDDSAGAAERKKKMGQERKAKILAEFQNRQKQFAQMNMTDDMELDDDDLKQEDELYDSNEWVFPESQCILCRMPDENRQNGSNNVFGLMGYVMHTNVVRNVPFDNVDWVYEGFGNEKNLDEDISVDDVDNGGNDNWKKYRKDLHENSNIGPGFPPKNTVRAAIMTGCGHGVHFQCYQEYLKSTRNRGQQLTRNNPEDTARAEYLCPLCRALNNTFLPILWKSNKRSAGDFLKTADKDATKNFMELMETNVLEDILTLSDYDDKIYTDGCTNIIPSYIEYMRMGSFMMPDMKIDRAISEPIQRIYQARLQQEFNLDSVYVDDLNGMVDCFAQTISALEVSLRGKGYSNPMGGIIMDQIPAQSLQMIRVFGELCKTYISYAISLNKKNDDYSNYVSSHHPNLTGDETYRLINPLDGSSVVCFEDFVSAALLTAPAYGVEVGPMLRSYCTAEITHVLTTIITQVANKAEWIWDEKIFDLPIGKGNEINANDEAEMKMLHCLSRVINTIRPHIETSRDPAVDAVWNKPEFVQVVYSILRKCLAPFLRKCAIFTFALCGNYDPYDFMGFGKDFPEIDKLCEYLGLQSVGTMIQSICEEGLEAAVFEKYANSGFSMFHNDLEYPSVVRLLRLPQRLDDFFNLRNKTLAGKVTSDIVPDPAVCLFCGTSVGMQIPAFDRDSNTGQCHEHVKRCGKDVGIFLLPKRSSMLLMKGQQGSYAEGPYLDLHGEADDTMK